jgi:hypothetical protein
MPTPGANLFRRASKLIKPQSVQYYAFVSRERNAARQWVPTFAAPVPILARVNAVPRKSYADMGLDFNSFYVQIFASLSIIDLQRDSSGDRFIWNGDWYQMKDGEGWFSQDGWATALAVRVKQNVVGE